MGSEEGTGCGLYLKGPEFLRTYFTNARLEGRSSHLLENKKDAGRPSRAANYDEMIRSCGLRPESYSSQPSSFKWPENLYHPSFYMTHRLPIPSSIYLSLL